MKSIEKNDVDISSLFKWSTDLDIVDDNGQVAKKVYIRLIGDAEVNRARIYALRKSAEFRKKLYSMESDEYYAFMPDEELVEMPMLVENILLEWTREYAQEAVKNIKLNLPVEPHSEATLEAQELYQKEVDEWPEKRESLLREYVETRLNQKRRELSVSSKNAIFTEYTKLLTNRLCENEMVLAYRNMCVYFGCYSDPGFKTRLFESFEEFENLATDIKNQLLDAYLSLEIDGENLKKLPEATQL